MDFNELKQKVAAFIKQKPEYTERAVEELKRIRVCLDENFDWFDYFENLTNYSNAYVIPYILGKTNEIDLNKPIEIRQIKPGDSGGLDVDIDYATSVKPKVKEYLVGKYGADHVCGVAAYSSMGLASSIKDILRKEQVPFKESNDFCKELDNEKTFLENMEIYKNNFPLLYGTYLKHKVKLDLVDKMSNILRNVSQHAAGTVITDKPLYKRMPVQNIKGEIVSSFVENGGNTELDEMGICKYDVLAITSLDIINTTVDSIKEKLYKIIDDDGIEKIVSESYLKNISE